MKRRIITTLSLSLLYGIFIIVAIYKQNASSSTEYTPTTDEEQPQKIAPKHGKVLVAYFSVPETDGVDASSGASRIINNGQLMGNTEYVASIIKEATNADLFEIKTAYKYPASHQPLIDAAKKEANAKARPHLVNHIQNIAQYDVIFVGFPNWWYDMPMPVYSFFDENDLSGKTIVPFCTHGGSRFSDAISTIHKIEPQATVFDGYAIERDHVANSKEGILHWLKQIDIK